MTIDHQPTTPLAEPYAEVAAEAEAAAERMRAREEVSTELTPPASAIADTTTAQVSAIALKPIPAWFDQSFVPYDFGARGAEIAARLRAVFPQIIASIGESRDFIAEVDSFLAEHDVDGDEVIEAVYDLTDVRDLYTKLYALDAQVRTVIQ